MTAYAVVQAGVVTNKIEVETSEVPNLPAGPEYVDISAVAPQPNTGWTYVDPDFFPPTVDPVTRYVLTQPEWIGLFTDAEWNWVKKERVKETAAGYAMDRMMDRIDKLGEVDVSAPEMDPFYDYLVNNGLPGGQTRIDELRAGVTE